MNKHFFTLTELLMAIGIIVILAAIAIPTTASAIKKAEQAKAQAQMAELTNALKNYESTYGSLPSLGLTADAKLSSDYYSTLINVLQGEKKEISYIKSGKTYKKVLNARKIKFLDVQGNDPGTFEDPWGNNYTIVFDADGDGAITITSDNCPHGLPYEELAAKDDLPAISDDLVITKLRKDLVIWSKGPDGNSNTDPREDGNADNVYSIPVDYDKANKCFTPSR